MKVTGASFGIGRAVVVHTLEKGDRVVATLRKPDDISDLVAKYPDIAAAFGRAIEQFGCVDVVYNNAGYATVGEIEGTPDDVARALFEVNFWGSANVAREAVHVMRDINRPCGGRIIQASSGNGMQSRPGVGYGARSVWSHQGELLL